MSKNEKRNSETNSLESNKLNNSVDRLSASTEIRTELSNDHSADHSDNEKIPKRLFPLPAIVPAFFRSTVNLFHQTVKNICNYGSFGYTQGKKAIAFLYRSVAFLVQKKTVSGEENTEVGNYEIGKESSKNISQPATSLSNQSTLKTVTAGDLSVAKNRIDNKVNNELNKDNNKNKNNDNINDIEDEEDDDDDNFRWVNLGFKVAAAAAIVLLLTGGYFGVKSFLGKTKPTVEGTEMTQSENSESTQQQQQQDSVNQKDVSDKNAQTSVGFTRQPTVTPEKKSVVEQTPAKTTVKQPEKTVKKTTENPDEKLTENPKVPAKTETVTTPFKEPEKTVPQPEKDVTVNNNDTTHTQTALPDFWNNPQPATTVTGFSAPIASPATVSPTDASPFPAVTTNHSAPPELSVPPDVPVQTEKQTEKSDVAENPLTLPIPPAEPQKSVTANPTSSDKLNAESPVTTTPDATDIAALTSTATTPPTPAPTSTPLIPVTAGATQLSPLKEQPLDSVSSSNSPISNISGDQSLAIPKSDNEIQRLSTLSTFSQPSSESSPNIPEQPKTDPFSGEFSKAPTPPEMSTVPSPEVEPVIPVVAKKKEETIPAIPKSGTIQPIVDAFDSASTSSLPSEPSPGIPTDSVTFAQPTAPSTVPQQTLATPTPYVPTTFGQSTASTPFISNTETNTTFSNTETAMNTGTITKTNEPALTKEPTLEIPKDAPRSASAISATETTTPAVTVPAILPQHVELAKTEPPLGSQLQNQVQEIRNRESLKPKLRFGSDASAPTGAVRYHPKSAVQNVTELVPTQPMPIDVSDSNSNPLVGLLPTGNPQPETANLLPPLETAPQSVTATPNPSYRRSLNRRDTPASVQPESLQSESLPSAVNDSERRARLFRRLDEDIKQSPTTTEQYTVQENDTYMTISDKFFKTSRLFRALAEHNRRKYGTDYKLSAGTVIEIPPADYLKSNYAEVLTRSGQRPEKNTTASIPVQGIRYTVQADDTVFRIATNQLRDSSRWQEIIDMNSDKLRSPRDLQPGMEIILPATTATQTTYGRR
ncbi:MAG: LysM peptidoglycan-binding domain-containing protein [Planctomycetaceae bacterium]|jgi:nucleoid-associated protein YgaU|nr:LysM peptidoglycan-binding domain-containing protein [Planctomycetaceae bacterium]